MALVIKPLVWSQSKVFGHMKRRGSSPFGEVVSFIVDDLTPEQIAEKQAAAQADYETCIRLAISLDDAPPPQPEVAGLVEAARDVLAERERQKSVEGWTPAHDDEYTHDELPNAAACYAAPESTYWGPSRDRSALRWPWQVQWWKPGDRRRNLVKAGALILAEIERLDRAALASMNGGPK